MNEQNSIALGILIRVIKKRLIKSSRLMSENAPLSNNQAVLAGYAGGLMDALEDITTIFEGDQTSLLGVPELDIEKILDK